MVKFFFTTIPKVGFALNVLCAAPPQLIGMANLLHEPLVPHFQTHSSMNRWMRIAEYATFLKFRFFRIIPICFSSLFSQINCNLIP